MAEMRFGEFLIKNQLLTPKDVDLVLRKQAELKTTQASYHTEFGNLVVILQLMSEENLCESINSYNAEVQSSNFEQLAYVPSSAIYIDDTMLPIIQKHFEMITNLATLPYRIDKENKTVYYISMADIDRREEFIARFVQGEQLIGFTKHASKTIEFGFSKLITGLAKSFKITVGDNNYSMYKPDLSERLQMVFRDAVKVGASDIFITPLREGIRIKFKVDGVGRIYNKNFAKLENHRQIANLIMGKCGINDSALHEGKVDGNIESLFGVQDRSWSARVSIMTTILGYKLVFRLIPNNQPILTIPQLGFPKYIEDYTCANAQKESGLFILGGHMGNGKSTTAYGMLLTIDNVAREVMTVEDPVERQLPGIGQVNVGQALSFAKIAQGMVRQAIDVMYIGETRDAETVNLSVDASNAGMLIMTTLHIDRNAEVWSRIHSLDKTILPRFIMTLQGLMTQKLVRKLCPHCRIKVGLDELTKSEQDYMRKAIFYTDQNGTLIPASYQGNYYRAKGCKHCDFTGYKGVQVLAETLPLDYELRLKLSTFKEFYELEHFTDVLLEKRRLSFKYQGAELLHNGITSVAELQRKCVFDFNLDLSKNTYDIV